MRVLQASSSIRAVLWGGTGKGVKVAVIDSGINPRHSHVGTVAGGTHVRCGDDGAVSFTADWDDSLGHGTAIAGVLRAKAPDAELYSVKVFDKTLRTRAEAVAAALRWSADHGMHVTNCSLSTESPEHQPLLLEACEYAARRGVLLVCASDGRPQDLFPASLPHVIAVAGDEACAWDEYYYGTPPSGTFRAHPHPRPLPRRPQSLNLRGHSFAAAHMAARIACIREQCPAAGREEMVRILVANASPPPA